MQKTMVFCLATIVIASNISACAARENVSIERGGGATISASDASNSDVSNSDASNSATPTPELTPVPTPTPESTPVPTPTPESTPVPTPTPESTPVPTPTPESTPEPNPVGVFKVCNTTSDGCICNAADNCTTNGITYNAHKPPTGSKKVILFFHGHHGSSILCDSNRTNETNKFLKNMYKKVNGNENGFGWICADSSDRVEKWWSTVNSSSNPDVVNLEKILAKEGYDETSQIYLIGHSNGGGFVSQMNTYSKLRNIRAVAFAHSAAAGGGGRSEVCDNRWITPTFITGSSRDTIVDWSDLLRMFDCLKAKGVPTQLENDVALQDPLGGNHNFFDQSELIAPFWFTFSK